MKPDPIPLLLDGCCWSSAAAGALAPTPGATWRAVAERVEELEAQMSEGEELKVVKKRLKVNLWFAYNLTA